MQCGRSVLPYQGPRTHQARDELDLVTQHVLQGQGLEHRLDVLPEVGLVLALIIITHRQN